MTSATANGTEVGVKGVQLKRFEQVIVKLLDPQYPKHAQSNTFQEPDNESRTLKPHYTRIPTIPSSLLVSPDESTSSSSCSQSSLWPWSVLPPYARVCGDALGQLSDPKRAKRKEEQLRSLLQCIQVLLPPEIRITIRPPSSVVTTMIVATAKESILTSPDNNTLGTEPYTIVDFGGGSGHLAIPLALLVPQCRVVVVDLSARSLALMHHKVSKGYTETNFVVDIPMKTSKQPPLAESNSVPATLQQCLGIPNLYSWHGPVHSYTGRIDMAVALHLCGEATDVVLRMAGRQRASIIVAPCCVGKLSTRTHNPYIYQATGRNQPTIQYPQSRYFQNRFRGKIDDWDYLAQAADYSSTPEESRTPRNASRRTAKALLEMDRQLYLEETFGYCTTLTRMDPWEATPKNDILLAWRPDHCGPLLIPDRDCQEDIQQTCHHLLVTPTGSVAATQGAWIGQHSRKKPFETN